MDEKPKQRKWFTAILMAIIVILVVQNYFLVKKYDRQVEATRKINEELVRMGVMKEGDQVGSFMAMTLDSVQIPFEPRATTQRKLLFVFTSWCGACIRTIPQWNEMAAELAGTNIHVVGISPDSIYKVKELEKRVPLSFPTLSIAEDSTVILLYKMQTFPQTVLLDSTGVVIKLWTGLLSEERKANIAQIIRQM